MSELTDIAAPTRTIPELPNRVLSRFDWVMFAEAEEAFDISHRRKAAKASIGLPVEQQDKLIAAAGYDGQSGIFAHGSWGFDAKVKSGSMLGFLLWVCLKPCNPKLTEKEAAALITPENEAAVQRAVMESMHYVFQSPPAEKKAEEKKDAEGTDPNAGRGADAQPPGDSSTKP